MNLSIDFNTLTLAEAERLEDMTGMGIDSIGRVFGDENAPKMRLMRSLATVAWMREHPDATEADATEAVGKITLTSLNEDMEVTGEDPPTDESAQ